MNIVYTSSNLYSRIGLVSIKSLLENNKDIDNIRIFYIENNISDENKQEILSLVHMYNREIHFIQMKDLNIYATGLLRTNIIVYSYCFLHELLPTEIDKVILIECDALVLGSIQELWDTDISNYYIAAADDLKSIWYKKTLGLKETSNYINSGIMLINLEKWRQDGITQKMRKLILSSEAKCFYEVQDEFNVLFEKQIKILHPKFNCTTALFLFSYRNMKRYRRPNICFDINTYIEATKNPVIVHFTSNQIIQPRPWIEDCIHPYRDEFLRYKSGTTVKNDRPWKTNKKIKNIIAYQIYKIMPQCITATLLGLFQAYLYPMVEYYKRKMKQKKGKNL